MKPKRFLVTSALPYANGPLHLGHIAGAYLPADIYVRYLRMKKRDVIYICGSDEHGVPITVTADKEGILPQDVVDRYHAMNKSAFEKLGISFDNYSRTSLPVHHATAREFFTVMYEKKDFIVKEAEQYYSEASQRFLPDRYVEGRCPHCQFERARGDQCDNCGKWLAAGELLDPRSKIDGSAPTLKKTKHWYLPMGRFADTWKKWFDGREWPDNVRNYCLGWYNEGLGDRPITRDLHWGVPVPLEEAKDKVLYVWFDAPIGYISSTKEWAENLGDPERWKEYWCREDTKLVHFIGKDNIVFHAILFPMMLMEMGGYVLPDAIPANEYLTIEGRKISTSQNYAIWVKDFLENYPSDPLRYTLAANAPESKDTDFSWRQFQSRNNDELADILGNFINRTITFVHRYFESRVPRAETLAPEDQEMLDSLKRFRDEIGELLEHFHLRRGVQAFMDVCRSANKYFNDRAPWETRKSDPPACAATIYVCVEVARALALLGAPVLPDTAGKIARMTGLKELPSWDDIGETLNAAGAALPEAEILFEKIEDDVIEREAEKLRELAGAEQKEERIPATISFEDFKRLELRTATVLGAERVAGTDRLLKVMVDLGGEERQIVAGIGADYDPGKLAGKTVILLVNLKPANIRGVESRGMLLAVKGEGGLSLLTTDGSIPAGSRVE